MSFSYSPYSKGCAMRVAGPPEMCSPAIWWLRKENSRSSHCLSNRAGHTNVCASDFGGYWGLAQTLALRSLRALPITETELKLIAAAANIGESKSPKKG